jgi:ABC-type Fe3+/spermidine/putrescine transport system ATPase subunit
MSDRIAVMHQGQALQIDQPRNLYDHPATRYVADFIGTTNFIEARVASLDGQEAVVEVDGLGLMRTPAVSDLSLGQSVTLAVRPEKIRVVGQGKPTRVENSAKGKIVDVVFVGNDTQVFIQLTSGAQIIIRLQNRDVDSATTSLSTGDDITVAWPAASTNLLTA